VEVGGGQVNFILERVEDFEVNGLAHCQLDGRVGCVEEGVGDLFDVGVEEVYADGVGDRDSLTVQGVDDQPCDDVD